jgi:hypothetical protein
MDNMNVSYAQTKYGVIPRYGLVRHAGLSCTFPALSDGQRTNPQLYNNVLSITESSPLHVDGDVQAAIFLKMFSQTIIPAGVRKRLSLTLSLDCHHILVVRVALNQEQDSAPTLANWFAMLDLAHLVVTWDPRELASVGRRRVLGVVWTPIMRAVGAAVKSVMKFFHVENTLVRESVTRGCVGAVRSSLILVAIVDE